LNFILLGIRIKRNSNIAAHIKVYFKESLYRDIYIELRLKYDKVSRSNKLVLL